jgi:hypothetical protein
MTTTINAVSGTGLTQTSDGSGIVKLQSNGVATNALAWVNFGYISSSISIRSSYNVSSVTRVSTGVYNVTFTNNLTDANYSAIVTTCRENGDNDYRGACVDLNGTYSTSTFRIATIVSGTTMTDRTYITAVVFGN